MDPERDQTPNFQKLTTMGSIDRLLEIAQDPKIKSEYREAAIDHLPHFFGTSYDRAITDIRSVESVLNLRESFEVPLNLDDLGRFRGDV